jgi:predicted  nucleic acid-binding Zn-ribbon protein
LKEKIKNLILLQECDNKIRAIDTKQQNIPLKIQALEKEFNERVSTYNAKFEKLESLKKERRSLEQLVQDLESKCENSRIKLSNIKSNKEYTAILKEIENLEKSKSQNEDQVLQIMEDIDLLDKECLALKQEQEREKDQLELNKNEIEKELDELKGEAAALKKQRSEYYEAVDHDLLSKYNMLKERKAGVAISAVIGGVCQSCYMNIPPQRFNELIKCNNLMACPNCNRLIYWGGDELFTNIHNEPS